MFKILLVDDNINHRTLIEEELADEGYQVFTACNAAMALAQVKRARPNLVITDVAMPGADGIELLRDIMALDLTTPVILYTGYAEYEDVVMAWAADAYVLKSSDLTELKQTIRRLLTEHSRARVPRNEAAMLKKIS